MTSVPLVQDLGDAPSTGTAARPRGKGHYLFTVALFALLFVPVLLHSILGIAISPVLSGSMRPVFNPGDALITKETKAQDLHVGDIVVLRNAGDYTLFSHRITSIKNIDFQYVINTKGDANPAVDAGAVKVSPQQLIPREIGHVPLLGREVVFFNSSKGRLISYALILLAFALSIARYLSHKTLAKHHAHRLHVPHLHHDIQPTSSGAEALPIDSETSPTDSIVQLQQPINGNKTIDHKGDDV